METPAACAGVNVGMTEEPGWPVVDADGARRLREALQAGNYTVDGVLELLGPEAFAALGREEAVPALRQTRGGRPLETLVRLFLLQSGVPLPAAEAALPLADCLAAGLVERDGAEVVARLDIRPYAADEADWWVVSDLDVGLARPRGPLRPDHVLGVGGSSTTSAQLTVRPPVDAALDLGTGCGVQALHLSRHAQRVTASDRNPRALRLAALTAALSGVDVELVNGSLFEPVAGRRFELVVSNPPFVVSPGRRFTYRDSGLPGDELCRLLVGQAPAHLTDGGWCQLLANWLHVRGQDWRERLAEWVVHTGCDAWVVQRDVQDPAEYAELWLRDSGDVGSPGYHELYDAWLDSFAADDVEAVGFGWVTLRANGAEQPVVRLEEVRHPVDQPLGPHVLDWFTRQDFLRAADDAALLRARLTRAPDVRLEELHAPAGRGWEPVSRRIQQYGGLRRSGAVDPVGAAVIAGCDGARELVAVFDDVAAATGMDPAALRSTGVEAVRALVEEGFLVPSG